MNNPVLSGSYYIKPVNNNLHQKYEFMVTVTAHGGSSIIFGAPYILDVGCTQTSLVKT